MRSGQLLVTHLQITRSFSTLTTSTIRPGSADPCRTEPVQLTTHYRAFAPVGEVGSASTAVAAPLGRGAATGGGGANFWGEYIDASTAENRRVPRPV